MNNASKLVKSIKHGRKNLEKRGMNMEKEKINNSVDGSDSDDYEIRIWTKNYSMNSEISRRLHPMEISDCITNFLLMLNDADRIQIVEIAFKNVETVEMEFIKRPQVH